MSTPRFLDALVNFCEIDLNIPSMKKGDDGKEESNREKREQIMMFILLPVDHPNTERLESQPLVQKSWSNLNILSSGYFANIIIFRVEEDSFIK